MPELAGTETHANLLAAFARTSGINRRYLWFAQQADIEGRPRAAALFRSLAESETSSFWPTSPTPSLDWPSATPTTT